MNISQQILEATNILLKDRISSLKFDQTIKGEVSSVVNVELGEYKITYENNTFSAFSTSTDIIYKVGDSVLVKIPQGDYSNKKIIESKATKAASDKISLIPQINKLYPTLYNNNNEYGLIAGVQPFETVININDQNINNMLNNYNTYYDKIQFTAKFRTSLMSLYTSGNYGLKFTFLSANNEEVDYYFTIGNFNGSPFSLVNFTEQSVLFEVEKNSLKELKNITFFQEGMKVDSYNEYIVQEDGSVETEIHVNDSTPNIFVKDIEISFVEIIDYSKDPFYISFNTPLGTTFENNDLQNLTIEAILLHYGEDVTNEDNCKCYWYKEDLSVTFGSDLYDTIGGVKWKLLDNNEFNKLTIQRTEIFEDQLYKVVIIYNNNTTLSKEILITKQNSNIQLIQNSEDDLITIAINNPNYKGQWYVEYPNGGYQLYQAEKSNSITLSKYLDYSFVTYYCAVYNELDKFLVNRRIVLEKNISTSDLQVTFIGDYMHKYDANGDINPELYGAEKYLKTRIILKEGYVTSFTKKWYINDVLISSENINPEKSMMQNLRVDLEGVIHYTIRNKFNSGYTNNTLTLLIETIEGQQFIYTKDIIFSKDGDQGTNGSSYQCIVFPCDEFDNKITSFTGLRYNNILDGQSENIITLKAIVYKDGEEVTDETIEYSWKPRSENLRVQEPSNQQKCSVQGYLLGDISYQNIIKLTIRVNNTTLYYNYPINIIVGNINSENIDTNIPQYVRYSASGTNPQYTDTDLYFLYNNIDKINSVQSLNEDLITIKSIEDLEGNIRYLLSPTATFDYSSGIGVFKIDIDTADDYILYPIMMYLNTYGNQAINDWDGTSIRLDTNNETILAPQIGAGYKNENNQFNGVLFGKVSDNQSNAATGIYGYKNGETSFSLDENGELKIKQGSISLGNNFFVDTNGNVTIKSFSNREDDILTQLQNTKKQVFRQQQPNPPYAVGDLWVKETSSDLKICVNEKTAEEEFAEEDWEIAFDYINSDKATEIAKSEVNAQTQESILNKLVNGAGEDKGLYAKDGVLYLNANLITAGEIHSGEKDSETGKYKSYWNLNSGEIKLSPNTGNDKIEISLGSEGLTIEDIEDISTNITSKGVTIAQKDTPVLTATKEGVTAVDLDASTYLKIGGRSRFENFEPEAGQKRTGCFWIG